MNTLLLTVGLLLCLSFVKGRSFDERRDAESLTESENDRLKPHLSQMRHRKRRWQSNYGYEYPPPIPPYYSDRRDYDHNQQDLLPKITRLLEEISAYVKRPPPPPQPIYIPYPVPYPVPQFSSCKPTTNAMQPNITNRYPEMEDTNQNWGFYVEEENINQDDGDGSRPISFEPIKPKRPLKRPAPQVEHGSEQTDSHVTQAPKIEEDNAPRQIPHICNAAIVSCCADENQKPCFNTFGCGVTYNNGKACETASINAALEALRLAYTTAS